MKAILVGRHAPEGMSDIEIVDQKNITWSTNLSECIRQWIFLLADANEAKAAILLQNVPGTLASALVYLACGDGNVTAHGPEQVGIIISKPGPREAGKTATFQFCNQDDCIEACNAIAFVNPNARIGPGMQPDITVDPPAKFIFDHIEWLT